MINKNGERLMPTTKFVFHLTRNIIFGIIFILIALFVGMYGYHLFENMTWVDAFVNAAMILSGMGPMSTLVTNSGKLFAGIYALFSGLSFIVIVAMIFSPVIHRFFHKIHLESR